MRFPQMLCAFEAVVRTGSWESIVESSLSVTPSCKALTGLPKLSCDGFQPGPRRAADKDNALHLLHTCDSADDID